MNFKGRVGTVIVVVTAAGACSTLGSPTLDMSATISCADVAEAQPSEPDGRTGTIDPSLGVGYRDSSLSIEEACQYDGTQVIAVRGHFLRDGNVSVLCEDLSSTIPPKCVGPALTIVDTEALMTFMDETGHLTDSVLNEQASVTWSTFHLTLFGRASGDTFDQMPSLGIP